MKSILFKASKEILHVHSVVQLYRERLMPFVSNIIIDFARYQGTLVLPLASLLRRGSMTSIPSYARGQPLRKVQLTAY